MEITVDKIYVIKLTELERAKLCDEIFDIGDEKYEMLHNLHNMFGQSRLYK